MNLVPVSLDLSILNPSLQQSKQMSKKYETMDTRILVEEILKLQLFELVSISVKKSRKGKNSQGRGIHIVKLRSITAVEIGGELLHPEIVIMNSYDGSSLLKVYVGIYRVLCENGLVIATQEFGQFSVRHIGTPAETAFEVAMGFLDNLEVAISKQREMAGILLTDAQVEKFTREAMTLRWGNVSATADVSNAIEIAFPEDEGNSLWSVYNRVQRGLTLGGFKVEGMKRKGRPLKSAVADTLFNQELFQLAMSYNAIDVEYEDVQN